MTPAVAAARLRILLVEDNPADVYLARESLAGEYFAVEHASTLGDGVALARQQRFDAALVDLSLPDEQGIDTVRRLRAELPELPLVVLTGLDDQATAIAALQAGAQDYLLKRQFSPELWMRALRYSIQRFRGELQIAQQARTLDALLNASADGILMFDVAGRCTYANRVAAAASGVPAHFLLGRTLREAGWPAEFCTQVEREIAEVAATGQPVSSDRSYPLGSDRRYFEYVLTPVVDATSSVAAIVCTARDVTRRRQAEAALRETELRLREVQKLEGIGKLAGGVAHEFNNLLTVIRGNLELLRESRTFTPEDEELVHSIATAAQRASSMTAQLLAFSRRQLVNIRETDLNEIVSESVRMLRPLLPDSVRLRLKLHAAPASIRVDSDQISQALFNLAINARDAMPGGGELFISTGVRTIGSNNGNPCGHFAVLEVRDTGHGMDGNTRARLFEPFFTTKQVGKGTGLGLAMVYGTVKQMGGQIDVSTEPGKGSAFTLYFPLAAESAA